jgi:hypothetical protein
MNVGDGFRPLSGGRMWLPQESPMRFVVCLIVLGAVPMLLLNGQGRPAFVGYYLGVLTLWLVFAIAASRARQILD